MFFSILTFFATLTGNDASNRLNIIIFVISRSISVEIDTSLALFKKKIGGHFDFFFENAVGHIGESYQPILLILNSKQWKTTFYLVLNFEENRTKIATVRVPKRKSAKWPPWRHRFRIFKFWEKTTSQISVRSFVENFIEIHPSVWAVALSHTHRRTHIHTYTHIYTHPRFHRNIFSQNDWIKKNS